MVGFAWSVRVPMSLVLVLELIVGLFDLDTSLLLSVVLDVEEGCLVSRLADCLFRELGTSFLTSGLAVLPVFIPAWFLCLLSVLLITILFCTL